MESSFGSSISALALSPEYEITTGLPDPSPFEERSFNPEVREFKSVFSALTESLMCFINSFHAWSKEKILSTIILKEVLILSLEYLSFSTTPSITII